MIRSRTMHRQVITKVLFIVVFMGTSDFALTQCAHQTDMHDVHKQCENNRRHPCTGNGAIPVGNGLVLCLVPTVKELEKQLKDIGGLNRHYAAVTKEEADRFVNLLPRPRPTSPPQHKFKPFPIIWSYLSSAVSHKQKTVSQYVKPESRNPKASSRNQQTVSQNFKSTSRNSKDVPRSVHLDNNIVSSKKTHCIHSGEQTEYGMFRLCTECQRISQLNSDRFPRYINEVACDNEIPSEMKQSVDCHRNQGMCFQRFLFIDFLVRTEKYVEVPSPDPDKFPKAFMQVWEPYTQKIRSCCECQIAVNK